MTFPKIQLALVTGASSGLGKALARALSEKGIPLILTGRNETALRELAAELPTPARYLALDLCLAQDRSALLQEIRNSTPDLILNNAGFGLYGDAISHPTQEQLAMIEVNVSAVTEITLAAAQMWKSQQKKGIILNVSSSAAYFSFPTFAIYAASKAFVLNFSKALDQELAPYGIRVLTTCPGQIDTGFRKRASNNFPQRTSPWAMSSEKAAKLILAQIAQGQRVRIIDWRSRWAVRLSRLIPSRLLSSFLQKTLAKRFARK